MTSTLATITAMRHQEDTGYAQEDYLAASTTTTMPLHCQLDPHCRAQMVAWCYSAIDFLQFSRETVAIAMSFLDRYLASSAGASAKTNLKIFQLAAMTALYTAIKIHEPEAISLNLISNLSRGTYTPKQFEEMEANLLFALKWRVNPPTALAFVRELLDLIPSSFIDNDLHQTIFDLAKYQTELAVNEYHLSCRIKPSTIAFCAIMNAVESVGLSERAVYLIWNGLSRAIGLEQEEEDILRAQIHLYEAVLRQPIGDFTMARPHRVTRPSAAPPAKASRRSSLFDSPRSIVATGRVEC